MNTTEDYIAFTCVWLFLIVIILAGILYVRRSWRKRSARITTLKATYDQALKAKDKPAALEAGRNYYQALRNDNKLTVFDEQAITNDLSVL